MSRLIDALQKAEEAKRKEAEEKDLGNTDFSDLKIEEKDEGLQTQSSTPVEPPAGSFELESTSEPEPEPENYQRRLTDDQPLYLDQQPEAYGSRPQKKRLVWLGLIALILFVGGGVYFYLGANGNSQQYNTNNFDQNNRGFLAAAPARTTSAPTALSNASNVSRNLESIIGGSSSPQAEPTTQETEPNAQAISLVNALITSASESTPPTSETTAEPKSVFKITRSASPEGVNESLSFAQESSLNGEMDAARLELDELINNQPNNINALSKLAEIELSSGNTTRSAEYFDRVLQLDPNNILARLGIIKSSLNKDAIAYESELKALAYEFPEDPDVRFSLGNHFASQKRWNEARNAYAMATAYAGEKSSAIFHFNYAIAHEQLRDLESALLSYRAAEDRISEDSGQIDPEILIAKINSLEEALQ